MNRETFDFLAQSLKRVEKIDTNWRFAIPLRKRIAITLYALGSSSEYRTIASLFGVGRTTVGEIVLDVAQEIWKVFSTELYNFYPPSQEKVDENVQGFDALGFPQCFAAVDGCHIEVNPPKSEAVDYFNFKGWHSMILFAAVDYRCRFIYINIGTPGRGNDSTVFENSKLKTQHENNDIFKINAKNLCGILVPVVLIGDSAFRLSSYMMKPFPYDVNNPQEKLFNLKLSSARIVVENAFGHLKARFRKIGRGLEVHIENTSIIIQACCILHNICNNNNDQINKLWLTEQQNNSNTRHQPHTPSSSASDSGIVIRKAIMNYLCMYFILNLFFLYFKILLLFEHLNYY